jgi:hypothetical protein
MGLATVPVGFTALAADTVLKHCEAARGELDAQDDKRAGKEQHFVCMAAIGFPAPDG